MPTLPAAEHHAAALLAAKWNQGLGWYRPGEGAGLIGAIVGAIIVLLVYA